jgi:hypothetical protein
VITRAFNERLKTETEDASRQYLVLLTAHNCRVVVLKVCSLDQQFHHHLEIC